MKDSISYTRKSHIFQELFYLFGKLVHSDLVREIEYLKVENEILRKRLPKRLILNQSERKRLIKYGKPLGTSLKRIISIVSYKTFLSWLKKRTPKRKSKLKRRPGRPRTKKEIIALILKLARENNWGYTRILAELKKLEIESISRNTIKNILKENGINPVPEREKDSWDNFIKRHLKTLWACDFFTKTVWTLLGPKTFHMLFFINISTRRVYIAGITKNPTREWTNAKAKTVSFLFSSDTKTKRLLIRDGDSKFSKEFDEVFNKLNVTVKKIPFRSPNLNPYAEGFVGLIKRECLDHFFVFGEKHLRYLVNEYVKYYNTKRPHSGINYRTPIQTKINKTCSTHKRLKCKEILGGLIRHYYWEEI